MRLCLFLFSFILLTSTPIFLLAHELKSPSDRSLEISGFEGFWGSSDIFQLDGVRYREYVILTRTKDKTKHNIERIYSDVTKGTWWRSFDTLDYLTTHMSGTSATAETTYRYAPSEIVEDVTIHLTYFHNSVPERRLLILHYDLPNVLVPRARIDISAAYEWLGPADTWRDYIRNEHGIEFSN